MTQEPNLRETIRKYLLIQLPDSQRQEFEQRLMTDDEVFEELIVCEDELIDLYVRDQLSPPNREVMEKHFLVTPDRQEKLRFAQTFNSYVAKVADKDKLAVAPRLPGFWSGQSWMSRAAAAVAVIAIISGLFWVLRQRGAPPPTLATLTLAPTASTRSGGAQWSRVKLPIQGDALKISLKLPADLQRAPRYRAELQKDDGTTTTFPETENDPQVVSFVIPANQLSPGSYAVKVYAINEQGIEQRLNANYFFVVE